MGKPGDLTLHDQLRVMFRELQYIDADVRDLRQFLADDNAHIDDNGVDYAQDLKRRADNVYALMKGYVRYRSGQ